MVVDLPAPVGPVTSTSPRVRPSRRVTTWGAIPSSAGIGMRERHDAQRRAPVPALDEQVDAVVGDTGQVEARVELEVAQEALVQRRREEALAQRRESAPVRTLEPGIGWSMPATVTITGCPAVRMRSEAPSSTARSRMASRSRGREVISSCVRLGREGTAGPRRAPSSQLHLAHRVIVPSPGVTSGITEGPGRRLRVRDAAISTGAPGPWQRSRETRRPRAKVSTLAGGISLVRVNARDRRGAVVARARSPGPFHSTSRGPRRLRIVARPRAPVAFQRADARVAFCRRVAHPRGTRARQVGSPARPRCREGHSGGRYQGHVSC